MKLSSIRKYLRQHKVSQRWSTFNGAFQGALAIWDEFDESQVAASLEALGQDPNGDLKCVYCGDDAATWDHFFSNVQKKRFSGHGHRIHNLVPACRTCNEKKRQLHWSTFFDGIAQGTPEERRLRREGLERFEKLNSKGTHAWQSAIKTPEVAALLTEYDANINEVRELIEKADELAAKIRKAVKEHDQAH
jgi:HNH endonuclease